MTVNGPMALRDVKDHLSEVVDQVKREHDRALDLPTKDALLASLRS